MAELRSAASPKGEAKKGKKKSSEEREEIVEVRPCLPSSWSGWAQREELHIQSGAACEYRLKASIVLKQVNAERERFPPF